MERILSSLFFLYLGFETLIFIFFFGTFGKTLENSFRAKRKISVKIPLSTTKRERALVRLDHRYRRHEEEEETSVVVVFFVVEPPRARNRFCIRQFDECVFVVRFRNPERRRKQQ